MEKISLNDQGKKMEPYKQSRRKAKSYIEQNEGRLTGLNTSCIGTTF